MKFVDPTGLQTSLQPPKVPSDYIMSQRMQKFQTKYDMMQNMSDMTEGVSDNGIIARATDFYVNLFVYGDAFKSEKEANAFHAKQQREYNRDLYDRMSSLPDDASIDEMESVITELNADYSNFGQNYIFGAYEVKPYKMDPGKGIETYYRIKKSEKDFNEMLENDGLKPKNADSSKTKIKDSNKSKKNLKIPNQTG